MVGLDGNTRDVKKTSSNSHAEALGEVKLVVVVWVRYRYHEETGQHQ
jgi:hypothetical protein